MKELASKHPEILGPLNKKMENAQEFFSALQAQADSNGRIAQRDIMTHTCAACGEKNPSKKCGNCKGVGYCSRECQKAHWPIHKKTCKK